MNQLEALRETILCGEERRKAMIGEHPVCDAATIHHLKSMLERIEAEPEAFSPAKLGRWLGYAQGVLVARGLATLEEMKDINRRHADIKREAREAAAARLAESLVEIPVTVPDLDDDEIPIAPV